MKTVSFTKCGAKDVVMLTQVCDAYSKYLSNETVMFSLFEHDGVVLQTSGHYLDLPRYRMTFVPLK